ncbi:MAG: transporter substrate binding protein [Candidatus Dependentiae bacterium]|nr:transporter substrate binding protein [Candidatus Dependentiae bacterium]
MNQFILPLAIMSGCLIAGLLLMTGYYLYLRYEYHKIKQLQSAAQKKLETGLSAVDHPVMRYSDYKKNFGSRSRNIAIIGLSKQPDTIETIAEFTETMRENGSYIYHFTNYWGSADQKETQRVVSNVILDNYHGLFTIGSSLTRLAKNISYTHNKQTPIVFARVHDSHWRKEQEKKPAAHMTGITVLDCWAYRIKMYLAVKPFMRSALVPLTHPSLYEAAQEVAAVLNNYGIMPHLVRVHGTEDLLNSISEHADKIDSIIPIRDAFAPDACTAIAKKCSEHGITFFSPFLNDINYGAAVALNTVNERFGYHAAQKMLAVLEENRAPKDIPVLTLDQTHPYEMHFNQMAMQTQGLDPSRITALALQYSTKVSATVGEDIELI